MIRTYTALVGAMALAASGFQFGAVRADAVATSLQSWVTTWTASPEDPAPDIPLAKNNGQTIRQRMRVTVGGGQLRVRLSNEFGTAPLIIGAASVAAPVDEATIKPASLRPLTFGGRSSAVIQPGAPALSDPIDFPLKWGEEVAISLYLPQQAAPITQHELGLKRAVITAPGDFTGQAHVVAVATTKASLLVSALLVPARKRQRLLVALGDSITDGDGDIVDASQTWPSDFARRLAKARLGGPAFAVVNQGIGGNQLLHDGVGVSALARFDRDVLALPGVTHVLLLEGLNDIGWPGATLHGHLLSEVSAAPKPEDLISGYQQLIARAHARGVKVIGATLTPFEGAALPGYYSEAKEQTRQAVNRWIRTSGAFDGVVDFDAVLRDPQHPTRVQARLASPDHLHPNAAGYQAMADAVDVGLLR